MNVIVDADRAARRSPIRAASYRRTPLVEEIPRTIVGKIRQACLIDGLQDGIGLCWREPSCGESDTGRW
ncbi:MAG: hypothetical protein QM766_05385 [Burkholderiaceae bacterium]